MGIKKGNNIIVNAKVKKIYKKLIYSTINVNKKTI